MKAVIVAGGFGNRLRPITDKISKSMIEIKRKPILQHQIEWLKKYGIKNILITANYKYDQIIDYFGDGSKFGVKINYFIEDNPMGNAGAFTVDENKKWIDENLIVLFGDILTNLNINDLLTFHNLKKSNLTIVIEKRKSLSSAIKIDSNNVIKSFIEKPKEVMQDAFSNDSIFLMSENLKDILQGGIPLDFSKDIFPKLINNGFPIFGFVNDRYYWREVGTIEKLNHISSEPDKAVFLDVDGVLCESSKWGEYVDSIEKFKWIEGAKETIQKLNSMGFYIFIASNKACIDKGLVTEAQIRNMYDKLFKNLPIQEIFLCPHRHDEGCECRKPKPGLIMKGVLKYNLDPKNCWIVGDNDIDIVSGESIGCKTILIGSHGIKELKMHPTFEVENIVEVVKVMRVENI